MIWIVYLIPLTTLVVLLLLTGSQNYWGYGITAAISLALLYLIHYLFKRYYNSSTEYHGAYVIYATYYEAWNELVVYYETVSEPYTDSTGRTAYRTRRVRRTRVVYHPPYWSWVTNTGKEEIISRSNYNELCRMWGGKEEFIDMHRNYHTIDGDAYRCYWNGEEISCITLTYKESYINPLKHSNSVFRYKKVTKEEAKQLNLHAYPPISHNDQEAIVGDNFSRRVHERFRYINATEGLHRQIRIYILVFDSKKHHIEVAERQRAYWNGGAKNEFVICLGMDGEKVDWCHTFSWMDQPSLGVKVEGYFLENTKPDMMHFSNWLDENLDLWKRKEWKDFKYLGLKLSTTQQILLFIAAGGLSYLAYYLIMIERIFI